MKADFDRHNLKLKSRATKIPTVERSALSYGRLPNEFYDNKYVQLRNWLVSRIAPQLGDKRPNIKNNHDGATINKIVLDR